MIKTDFLSKDLPVLVGYSGGADSVLLLHWLKELGYDCWIAHVNYAWCQEEDDLGIDISGLEKVKYVRAPNLMDEKSARNFRREMFVKWAEEIGTNQVVLGHHKDDHVETVLFRLIRGTGLGGMNGIKYLNNINNEVLLFRPLINMTKRDILDKCREMGLNWWEDPANKNTDYSRSKIRQDIVPEMEKVSPRAKNNVANFANECSRLHEYMLDKMKNSVNVIVSLKEIRALLSDLEKLNDLEIEYFWKSRLGSLTGNQIAGLIKAQKEKSEIHVKDYIIKISGGWIEVLSTGNKTIHV